MKKLFVALCAVAALAACAKEEIVSLDNGETIQFGNAFVNNAVRATDPSYSANDISSFKVYGTVDGDGAGSVAPVLIYPGATVSKNTHNYGVAWDCTDANGNEIKQYWVPGATYKFVGIVDGNKSGVTKTNLDTAGMPTTIEYTADGVTDLLCQTITKTAKTDGTANGLVAFNFTHLLSKVKFTVNNKSSNVSNYLHKVTNIKVSNAYASAIYNIAGESWGSKTNNGGQAFDSITADLAAVECANEKLLIPHDAATVSFTIELYYVNDGTETLVSTKDYAPTTTYKLEAAKAYNFNIDVKVGELIQFTVTEQPKWTNDPTGFDVPLQ